MSGLIWAQTVCNGYQQIKLVDKELNQVCPISLLGFVPQDISVGPDLGPTCMQKLSAEKIKWPLAKKEFPSIKDSKVIILVPLLSKHQASTL